MNLGQASILAGIAGFVIWAEDIARRFSHTSHGDNPWTLEAFKNAMGISWHVEKILKLIDGSINDAYRSPSVNAAVGGVHNSYHQLGLAVDIKPGGMTAEAAAHIVYNESLKGTLGPVRTVINENSWVHVDFHNPADVGPPAPTRFFHLVSTNPNKYEPVKP